MAVMLAIGLLLTLAGGWFVVTLIQHGEWFGPIMLSFGVMIGLGLVSFAFVQLLSRERVELDRVTGRGRHTRALLWFKPRRLLAFDLDRVARVEIVRRTEAHREGPGENHLCEIELRISKPRRTVRLAESADHRRDKAETLAGEVAAYLGVELRETDRRT